MTFPDFLKLYDSLPTNGWLTFDEAEFLLESAGATQGPILEVGSYYGRSACLLASLGRPVHCVDPFSGFDSDDPSGNLVADAFFRNIEERKLRNIKLHRTRVELFFTTERFGFAYLDGDHTYEGTLSQVSACHGLSIPRFCVHDYAHSGGGAEIKRALEAWPVKVLKVVGTMALCEF